MVGGGSSFRDVRDRPSYSQQQPYPYQQPYPQQPYPQQQQRRSYYAPSYQQPPPQQSSHQQPTQQSRYQQPPPQQQPRYQQPPPQQQHVPPQTTGPRRSGGFGTSFFTQLMKGRVHNKTIQQLSDSAIQVKNTGPSLEEIRAQQDAMYMARR